MEENEAKVKKGKRMGPMGGKKELDPTNVIAYMLCVAAIS